MKLFCINKMIEIVFSKSIKVNMEEFVFWLERFIPNIEFDTDIVSDYILFIKDSLFEFI